jgi:hypothetical protein
MGVRILVGNETKQYAGQMPGRNSYCLYFKGSAYSTVFLSVVLCSVDRHSLFSLALSKCHVGYVNFHKTGKIRFPVLEVSSLYFFYPHLG